MVSYPFSLTNAPDLVRYDDGQRLLLLQRSRVAHASALVEAVQESDQALRGFMPWAHLPQTLADQEARLAALDEDVGGEVVYHLYERDDGPLVGCIGLMGARVLNPLGLELGYWTRSSAAGRGLMTLGAKCAVVLAFEAMGFERVQCGFNENNVASQRVCEKVGFEEEARLRFFEQQPTDELRAQGYRLGPMTVMSALFRDDRPKLPWYPAVAGALSALDAQGALGWPTA